jgi:hypothetical protein
MWVGGGVRIFRLQPLCTDQRRQRSAAKSIAVGGSNQGLQVRRLGDAYFDEVFGEEKGLFTGGVTLPLALAELGLIDEYEFVVHPRLAATGDVVRGTLETCRLEARGPAGARLRSGGDAVPREKVAIGVVNFIQAPRGHRRPDRPGRGAFRRYLRNVDLPSAGL